MHFLIVFLILISLGVPIAIALGAIPFFVAIFMGESANVPVPLLTSIIYSSLDNFALTAVPLFIFGGTIITYIGVTGKLVDLCQVLVGRVTGGMSHINVVVSTVFGGLNGSAVGDAAAVGSIIMKPMIKMGFSPAYSAAITAASGTISAIIPPSIPFIVYATVVPGTSIGALFIGGILPGVLICVMQCVAGYFISKKRGYPKFETKYTFKEIIKKFVDATPALFLVFLIVFCLRGGIFTPTEVASLLVVYSLFLGFVVYRNLTLKILLDIFKDTIVAVGLIFVVIAFAAPFMWMLTRLGVTEEVTKVVSEMSSSYALWWLFVSIFILIAGMVMDSAANILILSPILASSAKMLGFDPFICGLVFVMLIIAGTATPPVGISLFVTASIAGTTLEKVSKDVIYFIMAILSVVVMILAFPELFKLLPRMFGYEV